jgi:hypothetical protein
MGFAAATFPGIMPAVTDSQPDSPVEHKHSDQLDDELHSPPPYWGDWLSVAREA